MVSAPRPVVARRGCAFPRPPYAGSRPLSSLSARLLCDVSASLGSVSAFARGTFDVELTPGPAELDGAVRRVELRETFHGDLQGDGAGLMLSGGDPQSGAVGYVAIETVTGSLDNRNGSFAPQQFGMIPSGAQTLHYEVVPGSGTGALEGITGTLNLTAEPDGTHRYELRYDG
jgi:hypothetical protein